MSFVSLTHPPTLGFSELKTPPGHGEVLVAPGPPGWIPAARANHKALKNADTPLLQSTLGEWRRRTREAITGSADRLIVVTGHQPAFIHPGVWANRKAVANAGDSIEVKVRGVRSISVLNGRCQDWSGPSAMMA